jgi:hypothetical protein
MRRIALSLAAAAVATSFAFAGTPAHAADSCSNEPGDVSVLGLVGVDNPGSNGRYAVCVLGGAYGVAIYRSPSGGTCIALIVDDQLVGSC